MRIGSSLAISQFRRKRAYSVSSLVSELTAAGIMAKMPFLAPFLSPAVQGAGASLAGAASQIPTTAPLRTGAMIGAGLDRLKSKKGKNNGKR